MVNIKKYNLHTRFDNLNYIKYVEDIEYFINTGIHFNIEMIFKYSYISPIYPEVFEYLINKYQHLKNTININSIYGLKILKYIKKYRPEAEIIIKQLLENAKKSKN